MGQAELIHLDKFHFCGLLTLLVDIGAVEFSGTDKIAVEF